MMSEAKDYTYRDELGPIIEVPIKLRMPKALYEVWQDITTNYVGWSDIDRREGFEADLNWETLRLYIGYLQGNNILLEHMTSRTFDHILEKHRIDREFLNKADDDAGYVEAMILHGTKG